MLFSVLLIGEQWSILLYTICILNIVFVQNICWLKWPTGPVRIHKQVHFCSFGQLGVIFSVRNCQRICPLICFQSNLWKFFARLAFVLEQKPPPSFSNSPVTFMPYNVDIGTLFDKLWDQICLRPSLLFCMNVFTSCFAWFTNDVDVWGGEDSFSASNPTFVPISINATDEGYHFTWNKHVDEIWLHKQEVGKLFSRFIIVKSFENL